MSSRRQLLDYRPDIDALRAIAVMSVVIFHAQIFVGDQALLPGGFLGVDVFFVISGFLITSLIRAEIQAGQFSFLNFYERRARRLLPALLAMFLVVLPLGWYLLVVDDRQGFFESLIAAIGFVSNIYFYLENPYGANALWFEPLIHTWSLAVEEQYYLIFPVLFYFLVTRAARYVFHVLMLLVIASFILAVMTAPTMREFAFYLLPTRLWELLAGGLLALKKPSLEQKGKLADALVIVGLLLIVSAMLVTDESDFHPSWITLVPVLGTVMVIWGGSGSEKIAPVLANKPMVFIGLISYSLYLWHQPLLVFTRHFLDGPLAESYKYAVIIVSIIAAYMSWLWLERPIRNPSVVSQRKFLVGLISVAVITIGLSFAMLTGVISYQNQEGDVPGNGRVRKEFYGDPESEPVAFLLGDSHANALASSLDRILKERKLKVIDLTFNGCLYSLSMRRVEEPLDCLAINQKRHQALVDSSIRKVIVFVRATPHIERSVYISHDGVVERPDRDVADPFKLPGYTSFESAEELTGEQVASLQIEALLALQAAGKQLIVVEPVPEMGRNPYRSYRSATMRGFDVLPHAEPVERYYERNKIWLNALRVSELDLFQTQDLFCDSERCYSMHNERWLYADDDHPSIYGADRIVLEILERLSLDD